jgi:hypothetical protein
LSINVVSGYGLGGLFGAIARRLIPFAKEYILPHALTAAKGIASDVLEDKSKFRESLKSRGIGALKSIGRHVITGQKGSGLRRVKKHRKRVKLKTKKLPTISTQKKRGLKRKLTRKTKKSKKPRKENLRYLF